MAMLPPTCEHLVNATYNYITASSARMHRFKTLQGTSNNSDSKPLTVLKPVQTRWTSVYYCIVRNLRLWPVLTKFFELEIMNVQQSQVRDREMNPQQLYDNYRDPMMLIYQLFLEWTLKKFVKFNEKFQREKSLASEKQVIIAKLYKFFLNIYMKSDYVKSTPAELIDPHDINNFLDENEINLPDDIRDLMNEYVENDFDEAVVDMTEVKNNCKNYARHAAAKIEERFDLQESGMFLMRFLNPENALSKDFHDEMPDFENFLTVFPRMLPIGIADTAIINKEWENLLKYELDPEFIQIKDPRRFWAILHKFNNEKGEMLFTNLCQVAYNALSLPNSNASPERIWSRYNFMKNKWRASFISKTVKAMLQAYEYVKSVGGALEFNVTEQMFNLFNSDNLYSYTDPEEDNVSEGENLLDREEFDLTENYVKECALFNKLFKNKERGKKVESESDSD